MKKAEFYEILSGEWNKALEGKATLTKKQVEAMYVVQWDVILKAMKKGDEVVLDYGKWFVKKSPAREGRNPATGAVVKIPAKIKPQFRPNKKFKDNFVKK